ncbi:MAG: LysE family translocator [Desulfobulbus sp.]|nr:MAG: LysE family translocator [Desulfobulbus sp.]
MEFLLIASAHFVALLSPGPDFFLILQTSLRMPLKYAFAVCCGIAAANGLYLFFAVTGLEAIREMNTLMEALKYLGGGYLVYIGILLLKAPARPIDERGQTSFIRSRHLGKQFMIGFMSAILNPKNAVFYLSLFTAMVSPHTPLLQRAAYGVWMTAMVLVWDTFLAAVLSGKRIRNSLSSWVFYLEKTAGIILCFFGIMMSRH